MMTRPLQVITPAELDRRKFWIGEIRKLSGNFQDDFTKLQQELSEETEKTASTSLIAHLRLCGAIPEDYDHDSSEEKLYSKYTDAILAGSFNAMGIRSFVLNERADCADVECVADGFSFVADAKAFRLSRTAKNQKDFKVQAMHGWKRGKDFAVVVCPSYQLPASKSQIYQQAIAHNVCLLTYSHLSVLVQLAVTSGPKGAVSALHAAFKVIDTLSATKESLVYWRSINQAFLGVDPDLLQLWRNEKLASLEALEAAKEEALTALAQDRERIMRLSHHAALAELVGRAKIETRERVIKAVRDNGILDLRG